MNINTSLMDGLFDSRRANAKAFENVVDVTVKGFFTRTGLSDILGIKLATPFNSFNYERQGEELRLPFLYAPNTDEYLGFHYVQQNTKTGLEGYYIDEKEMATLTCLNLTNKVSSLDEAGISAVFFKVVSPYHYPPLLPEEAAEFRLKTTDNGKIRYVSELGGQGLALKAAGYDSLTAPAYGDNNHQIVLLHPSRSITRAVHFKF